jgi:NitT/TauT family transport system permease protein
LTDASRSRSQDVTGDAAAVEREQAEAPAAPAAHSAWQGLFTFRGTTSHVVDVYVGIAGLVAFLGLWALAAAVEVVPAQYLASPQAVVFRLYELLTEHNFSYDIAISLFRVWVAFMIAAAMAIPLGILMSSFRVVNGLTEPIVDFIRYLPVPALVPLTVIWLGIGEVSKIALLWMGTFFQLVLLIADDARRVPREYVEIGMTVGARPRQVLRHVILPAMMPSMVDNLRITLGWCWTYLIVAEIVASNSGIGYVIWSARRYVKTPEVMAGILTIGIIGLLTDQAIRWAHRRYFTYLR